MLVTRKAGAFRCSVCGHPADPGGCGRNHGPPRSLNGEATLAPGRGLPPVDLVSGTTDVVRSFFTIVLGREFVGRLRGPVAANVVAFLLFVLGFWFGLLPAFEGAFADDRNPALWAATAWILFLHPVLDLLAGPAQKSLRTITERAMLGHATEQPRIRPIRDRLRHRAAVFVGAAVLLLFALAAVRIPWIGLPLVFVTGAALAAFVWFDPVTCRCDYDLRERAAVLWRNRWRALGVGIGIQLAGAVPFLNLILLPSVAAVATTSAFVRFDKGPATLPGSP